MHDVVLIADADRERAQRIARPLVERGIGVAFAETGAAALESALADVPDALIATDVLPLIEAPRLAEILRANPRTRGVRLVYAGADAKAHRALFDEALTDAAQASARALSLLGEREQRGPIERASASESTVEGDLSQISLVDVLQLLHQNRRTGCLAVTHGEGAQPRDHGEIWLREGNVVQASAPPRAQDEKALYRMLGWREGSFSFTPNDEPRPARIHAPTRSLLQEGLRQLDEWARVSRGLPPDSAHVMLAVPRTQVPNLVHPVAQEVLLLLEAYDDVRSIVDHCTHSDYQVLRTLQTLIERGIVRQRRDRERRGSPPSFALFDAGQAKRLREWLDAQGPRRATHAPAKLLLASADAGATGDLLRTLAQLPGVERARAADAGAIASSDLASLARLTVAEGLAIELLHVPAGARYVPLWPSAAHGALGLLLLHVQPVAASEAALAPLADAFRALPGHRLFHVVLIRKGERVAPEEVREKLTLLNHASLFLLHLEAERDPGPLLRTMLARVMP